MATQIPTYNSDDDDGDYVPTAEPDDESFESSDEEPESKRLRVLPPRETSLDEAEKKKAKESLWASFQASVSSAASTQPIPVKEMVKVEKRFQFAGETLVEVIEVPANSPEAKKWHAKKDNRLGSAMDSVESELELPSGVPSDPSTSTKPATKRPGPRKPKTTLAAIPTQKAKKLSTLGKSAMDWQAHVQTSGESGLKDELEANRRGGGYLERVEFLNRVDERKEGVIETIKGSKRRRN
ncbi:Craniofacial development protein 1 [Termitomyces sp. J132]|nr:hypothetical protein C0989_010774 [Termitomyces sp. Mn162]KAH0581990.1 hypothetical protein H2248_011652 [Termitomyces sp. 'cryptogamus']KNZ73560.1 Craniofacial development protein 1 [Termitomyces sp. J132]